MARVLVIGDTHCPGMKAGYVRFLKGVSKKHKTTRVVHIGDLVDWASINYHEKHPGLPGPSHELADARKQVRSLSRAFPKADWLLGNHDCLSERQAITAGIPIDLLRDYNEVWGIDWAVHERFASLTIDGVIYSHGDSGAGGKYAAFNQAKENFQSTVIGHFHSQGGVTWWANPQNLVFGLSVGCGINDEELRFVYARRFRARSLLGCGVVIDGKQAIFEPWLKWRTTNG